MQAKSRYLDAHLKAIEQIIAVERRSRLAIRKNPAPLHSARIYIWNCQIAEEFYLAMHFAEILTRNAIRLSLHNRFGKAWYKSDLLYKIADSGFTEELIRSLEKIDPYHSGNINEENLIENLGFAFWEHLTTKRFERLLWAKGLRSSFPFSSPTVTLHDIHNAIEDARHWRNRIAHHKFLYNRDPMTRYNNALNLIGFSSKEIADFVRANSRVSDICRSPPE